VGVTHIRAAGEMRPLVLVLAAVGCLALFAPSYAAVAFYVNTTGVDGGEAPCETSAAPCSSLSVAVAAARSVWEQSNGTVVSTIAMAPGPFLTTAITVDFPVTVVGGVSAWRLFMSNGTSLTTPTNETVLTCGSEPSPLLTVLPPAGSASVSQLTVQRCRYGVLLVNGTGAVASIDNTGFTDNAAPVGDSTWSGSVGAVITATRGGSAWLNGGWVRDTTGSSPGGGVAVVTAGAFLSMANVRVSNSTGSACGGVVTSHDATASLVGCSVTDVAAQQVRLPPCRLLLAPGVTRSP